MRRATRLGLGLLGFGLTWMLPHPPGPEPLLQRAGAIAVPTAWRGDWGPDDCRTWAYRLTADAFARPPGGAAQTRAITGLLAGEETLLIGLGDGYSALWLRAGGDAAALAFVLPTGQLARVNALQARCPPPPSEESLAR